MSTPNFLLALGHWFRQHGVHFYWDAWVWPETEIRFNSSLTWGASPYKQWGCGPVRYRRYLK